MRRLSQSFSFLKKVVSTPTSAESQLNCSILEVSDSTKRISKMIKLSQPKLFVRKRVSRPTSATLQVVSETKVVSEVAKVKVVISTLSQVSVGKNDIKESCSLGSQVIRSKKVVSTRYKSVCTIWISSHSLSDETVVVSIPTSFGIQDFWNRNVVSGDS